MCYQDRIEKRKTELNTNMKVSVAGKFGTGVVRNITCSLILKEI